MESTNDQSDQPHNEAVTEALVKYEQTNGPPGGGPDEKTEGGYRFAWDYDTLCWRMLSKGVKQGVQPFRPGYTPVKPFQQVASTRTGKRPSTKSWLCDANGIHLTKNGNIHRGHYPSHFHHFIKQIWTKGTNPKLTGAEARADKAVKALRQITKDISSLKQYVDENNQPKPELIMGFLTELWRIIHARPEVITQFFKQVYSKALKDPVASLTDFQKLTGSPLQLLMAQTPQGQYVKLNIFNSDTGSESNDSNEFEDITNSEEGKQCVITTNHPAD